MGDRGYILSWDALIALGVVLFVLVGFLALPQFRSLRAGEIGFQQIHLKTEDAMETMLKEGTLRKITRQWAQNNYSDETAVGAGTVVGATLLSRQALEPMINERAGYKVIVDDVVVYSTDWEAATARPGEAAARDETRAVRYVSGLAPDNPELGWAARAWLVGNFTRHQLKLRYPCPAGSNLTAVSFPLNKTTTEETACLVLPKNSVLLNGSMNISWDSDATPDCPMIYA